jgi:transcriptional/translational regulatory protein YebC/TACO1
LVKALTDNKNRTVSEIRTIFNKSGGSLGTVGSTSYIFASNEVPFFFVDITDREVADKLIRLSEDLEDHDDVQDVHANFNIILP